MIYQSIPLTEVNERLPQGKTARTRLRVYARPEKGLLADGDRWAVVICPGGGYGLTAPTEGEPVALAFLAAGVQAFVLDYSVAPDRWPQSFLEAASAVAWVRAHAADYGVAPNRIAVCGFSAGGHLAGCVAGLWQHPVLREQLALVPEQVRPDAAILCYPVITAEGPYASQKSFANLLGEGMPIPEELSLEKQVTAEHPRTFLWATVSDGSVPVENTMSYAAALRAKGVPFELHLYADGPHAMGLATEETAWKPEYVNPHAASWHKLCVEWLKEKR